MKKILLVNGPNLNTLGKREPEIYGSTTLLQIEEMVKQRIEAAGHHMEAYQSNHEGQLVDWLQSHADAAFVIINAAAYTHTSIALRDCLAMLGAPFIEVHISNVYQREDFRKHSYLADKAVGVISGLGARGYDLAAQFALAHITAP